MRRVLCILLFSALFPAALCLRVNAAATDYGVPVVYIDSAWPAWGLPIGFFDYHDATVTIVDRDGTQLVCDEAAQSRVFGNSSARSDKLPYKLKLSEKTDLFGMGAARRWSLVPNHFDKTLLRNKLMYGLADDIGLDYSPQCSYVELYYNGRYLGNYLMVESTEVGENRVDICMVRNEFLLEIMPDFRIADGETVTTPLLDIRLEFNDVPYLPPDQREAVEDFFLKAETALLTGEQEEIERYFDIDSFINAYLVHEFSKNPDLSTGSTRFYIKGGLLCAGPMWDFDLSCGNGVEQPDFRHQVNRTVPVRTDGWYACQLWWRELVQCDWFLERFAARYREVQPILVNLYEDNELGRNRIDAIWEDISLSIEHNYTIHTVSHRYYGNERIASATYELNVEYLRNWLRERNEWILAQIARGGRFITVYETEPVYYNPNQQ